MKDRDQANTGLVFLPLNIVLPKDVRIYTKTGDGRLKQCDLWLKEGDSVRIRKIEKVSSRQDEQGELVVGEYLFENETCCYVLMADLTVEQGSTVARLLAAEAVATRH